MVPHLKRWALFLLVFVILTCILLQTKIDPFVKQALNAEDKFFSPTASTAITRSGIPVKIGDEGFSAGDHALSPSNSALAVVHNSNSSAKSEFLDTTKAFKAINIPKHKPNDIEAKHHDSQVNSAEAEFKNAHISSQNQSNIQAAHVSHLIASRTAPLFPYPNETIWAQVPSVRPPFAYVFIIWGSDPDRYNYKNYIANTLIAAKILRRHGSQADILLFVILSSDTSHTRLWPHDEDLLFQHNITIGYLPKNPRDKNVYYMVLYDFFDDVALP